MERPLALPDQKRVLPQEADVAVQELDWIICNGGADVWHLLPERDGKEATWVADEQWEGHISFRCPS